MTTNDDLKIRPDLKDISNTVKHLYALSNYFVKVRSEFGRLWYGNDSDLQTYLCKIDDLELLHLMEEFYRTGKDASHTLALELPLINNEERYPVISDYLNKIKKSVESWKKIIIKLLDESKKAFLKRGGKLGHWKIERLVEIHKEILSNLNALENEFKTIKKSERYKIENNLQVNESAPKNKYKIYSIDNKNIWSEIKIDFDVTKRAFGKKIHFVKDAFKRKIIFRDIEHAYFFAQNDFSKPAVILAGGVIEELLRHYLKFKNIKPSKNEFNEYIRSCENKGLFKKGISKLSDSLRHFRNIVHLEKEESSRYTISKATAKGAISSIFTISNDF